MAVVIITNIHDISEDEFNLALDKLNPKKYERVMNSRFYEDKLRSVSADISARKAISQITGLDFDCVEISEDENGKPYFEDIYLSLSHSGSYAVCAADFCPIGIDIEKCRDNINSNLSKRICTHPDEQKYIKDGNFKERIIEIWTIKEACFKALVNQPKVIGDIKLSFRDKKLICDGISFVETKKFKENYIISVAKGIKM